MSKYTLDNAAIVFPSIYSKKTPNCFRISSLMYEDVNKDCLETALNITLKRFKLFNVKLKAGFFWYYFDQNPKKAFVNKENSEPFESVKPLKRNNFLFSLTYCGKRINLEIFHALTDANVGIEFLKTICFYYLKELGIDVYNDNSIIDNQSTEQDYEYVDDFKSNYDINTHKLKKDSKAFMLKGTKTKKTEIIQGVVNVNNLKEVSKKYNATITQYLGGSFLYSIYLENKNTKLPIKLFIPINARKYFDSKTLRNFMLYTRCELKSKEVTLENCIMWIKETLNEVDSNYLKKIIKTNVEIERNKFIKICPLFVKHIVIKIGYKIIGLKTSTSVISNIGEVKTPMLMRQYIDRFEFGISPSPTLPVILGVISYNNKLVMTFTKTMKEKNIIKNYFNILTKDIEIIINTNL